MPVEVRDQPAVREAIDLLSREVAVLERAPAERIGAARRVQGAQSRKETAAQGLFDACAEVRRRVKVRWRGPKHVEMRRAFGEGMAASPQKPETVLQLAMQIAAGAGGYWIWMRPAKVYPTMLARIARLAETRRQAGGGAAVLRAARKEVQQDLEDLAQKVHARCEELEALLPKDPVRVWINGAEVAGVTDVSIGRGRHGD